LSKASEVGVEGGSGMSTTIVVDSHKLIDVFEVRELSAFRVWHLVMVQRVGECTYEQGQVWERRGE
jgi:hypothetical protein